MASDNYREVKREEAILSAIIDVSSEYDGAASLSGTWGNTIKRSSFHIPR